MGHTFEELAGGLAAQRRSVGDDDAVQEGFLRTVRRAPEGLANPGGYWHVASRRALLDARRRDARRRAREARWAEAQWLAGDDLLEEDEPDPAALEALRRAVGDLRGRRRDLAFAELAGVTRVADLAERLGTTPAAVRVLRHRTYRQLRRLLEPA